MRFGRKRDPLERRLEAERPQPSDEFVSRLAGGLTPALIGRRSGWQIAFAAVLTTLLVAAFAATGGVGYAAKSVKGGTTAVTDLVTGPSNNGQAKSNNGQANKGNGANDGNVNAEGNGPGPPSGDGNQGCPPGTHFDEDSDSCAPNGDGGGNCGQNQGNGQGGNDNGFGRGDDCVASSSGDQYEEKVLICHIPPGNPGNPQTISVSVNAVPAHLAHGDSVGPCEA